MKSRSLPPEPSKTNLQFLQNHIDTHAQSFLSSNTTYDLHHSQESDGKKNDLKCIPSKTTTAVLQGQEPPVQAEDDAVKVARRRGESASSDCLSSKALQDDYCGRERLKRHRIEVAGSVWIPDIWGQEELLKDWIDCSAFDASLVNNRIMSARAALVEQGRTATTCSGRLRIENRC